MSAAAAHSSTASNASEVTTLWRYTNVLTIIIIIIIIIICIVNHFRLTTNIEQMRMFEWGIASMFFRYLVGIHITAMSPYFTSTIFAII